MNRILFLLLLLGFVKDTLGLPDCCLSCLPSKKLAQTSFLLTAGTGYILSGLAFEKKSPELGGAAACCCCVACCCGLIAVKRFRQEQGLVVTQPGKKKSEK